MYCVNVRSDVRRHLYEKSDIKLGSIHQSKKVGGQHGPAKDGQAEGRLTSGSGK